MSKHALIVGSSGIIGYPLSQHLLWRKDWKVTGVTKNDYDHKPEGMDLISCDVSSLQNCESKLGSLENVTHIFYVIWVDKGSEEENCYFNRAIIKNILNVIQKKSNLVYFYLQTGTKHYGNWVGPSKGQITPAREDNPRLRTPMFYYDLEEVLFQENQGKSWTYNIARPPTIIGWSVKTAMNFGVSLAVYATILKEMNQPLIFPYSEKAYNSLREFADARIICQLILWMAPDTHKAGKKLTANEAFNVTNGDYYRMDQLWPKIASYFNMEAKLADSPTSIEKLMEDKDQLWRQICQKYKLKKYALKELGTWSFLEGTLSREFDELTLVQKVVKAGFTEQIQSETMFYNFF